MSTFAVHIVFPPQFEPYQPYLSGPYIGSWLVGRGVVASVFDANVGFYESLLAPGRDSASWPPPSGARFQYLFKSVVPAVQLVQQVGKPFVTYRWAVNVLDRYFRALSPEGTEIGLADLTVGNRHSSARLCEYIGRPHNVFSVYFERSADSLLGVGEISTYLLSLVVIDQLPAAVVFAREIKRRRPGARVFVGGPLVSRLHRQLRAVPGIAESFDGILPGEAYRVLPKVLGLPGLDAGHVTPDFSDLDLDRYWSCRRVLPYLVAHGCRWGRCAFCSHHASYDGYRASPMRAVLDDLEMMRGKYGAEYITFSDEYLTARQLGQLAAGLLERGLGLRWSTFVRAEPAFRDEEFVGRLYRAGCRLLMFGLESGSQRVLDAMRKGTRVEDYRPILAACKAANVAVRNDFLVGFPGETEEDAEATYRFICENRELLDTPFSSYAVAAFELRSGTPVMEEAAKFGIRPKARLRGDLDDQYEYEYEPGAGLDAASRARWRERLIRFFKTEMRAELICPQNKTHQLILKDLWDQGLFELPVTEIAAGGLEELAAELGPGVELLPHGDALRVVNYANGGELEVSSRLRGVMAAFSHGTVPLAQAFALQDVWGRETFSRLIDFLYRNDYIVVHRRAARAQGGGNHGETEHGRELESRLGETCRV